MSILTVIGQAPSFWLLGIINVIAFIYIYYRVPEAKGRTLESIEADLRENALRDVDADQSKAE